MDHHLEGLALDTLTLVAIDGTSLEIALGTITVGVDLTTLLELLEELGCELGVEFFRYIA